MTRVPAPPPGWVAPGRGPDGRGGWVRLVTPESARQGDEAAVAGGETWVGLMRRAAGHLARGVLDVAGGAYGRRVVLLVGKGDNGGDGWAAAGLLRAAGAAPTVVALHGTDTEASEATAHFRSRWLDTGGRTVTGLDRLAALLAEADVVVDCLLGTGTTGAPRGEVGDAVEAVVDARDRRGGDLRVVACDVPTGVDATTGAVPGSAVTADLTVTFGAVKQGLLLHPAARHVGRLQVGSLGERYPVLDRGWAALTAGGAAPAPLADDAEKRTRGVALAVVGSVGAAGAAALCARGLLSGGAGLVTAAVPAPIQSTVAPLVPPAMTRAVAAADGAISAAAIGDLDDAASDWEGVDVVVAGPGLTPRDGTRKVVEHLLAHAPRLVLDADALNVFRDDPEALGEHAGPLVLTPHARELAPIRGRDDVADHERARVAREVADRLGATVVAKGPATVVAAPDGRTWVTPVGGPALATGGTGDVLSGLVGAAAATADDVPLAVARAVWQHGFAGDVLGARLAGRLTADVLAGELPAVLDSLRRLATRRPAWPFDGAPGRPDGSRPRPDEVRP